MRRPFWSVLALFVQLLPACSSSNEEAPSPQPELDAAPETIAIDDAPNESATDGAVDDGSPDAPIPTKCIDATGTGTAKTNLWVDGADQSTVVVTGDACSRTYAFTTTATLRDDLPKTRTVSEAAGRPFLRSKNDMFDALYALALDEVREDSVTEISDGAFDDGKAIPCDCFQTGKKWTYVWTRDTSYSVALGLAAIDPSRARRSLEFKLSELRTGGGREIVQDTGSGGSYPVSTDRVVWAMGAAKVLELLDGDERTAFRDLAYDALKNTIERDRVVVYDPSDGLYRGEQSFLDWREQTYAAWTASDVVHIAMAKALSTNVAHAFALQTAADLAKEKGDGAASAKYAGWASDLRAKITSAFWLEERGQLTSHTTTFLDPAPVEHFDALGTALASLFVSPAAQAKSALAKYPHLSRGVPVIWPQQKETAIYHNRAIWPFVTAFMAKAGKNAGNDAVVENAIKSLVRGAALNLSNMENFEMVTGKPWVDDASYSGPVVDSQRQLWSVAGYLSMVHDVLFGMETSGSGIRFQPFVPKKIRDGVLGNADSIALNQLSYKGKSISVVVKLPPVGGSSPGGSLGVGTVTLNGAPVAKDEWLSSKLLANNVVEITLVDAGAAADFTLVTSTADYKDLFGPRAPNITSIDGSGANLKLTWNANGEAAGEVAFDVYRDGVRIAKDLPGSTTSFTDTTATASSPSYCYAVDAYFVGSKNHGQHSQPSCWWGTGYARTSSIDASKFTAVGGVSSTSHGKLHYDGWGDPDDTITTTYAATRTGEHLLQLSFGNGAGPINTGITCGLKRVRVLDGSTEIARGLFVMPHLGTWDAWRDSSFVRASLTAGKSYTIVLEDDAMAANMSRFQHFTRYTGGTGGASGAFSRVNVAEVKVLARTP